MDNMIDELIEKYELSDYEALVVTGLVGIFAQQNIDLKEIYSTVDTRLKPIVNEIINQ